MFFVKDFSEVRLLNAYISKRTPKTKSTTEPRNFACFGCRLSGSSVFYRNGKELRVESPDTVYIPQNIEYSQTMSEETVAVIHFSVDSDRDSEITVLPAEIGRDTGTMTEICNAYMHGSVTSRLNAAAMFYAFLARLARFYSNIKDYRVKKAKEYMNANLSNPDLDIENVAAYLGISSVFLRKLFRENSEDTPVHTLNAIRINEAKRLLVQSGKSINEISALCGFREAKYFSKVFHEKNGVTALTYRNMFS